MQADKKVKRSIEGGNDEDDLLVTHSFKIHDNFDKEKSQLENKDEKILNNHNHAASTKVSDTKKAVTDTRKEAVFSEPAYHQKDSFSFNSEQSETFEEAFDPNNVEVCMNITCLIAGVAALLILQLIFIFVWTHFLQRRNRKKFGIPAM